MKTTVIVGNRLDSPSKRIAWYGLADSALANVGKPFFIPDFDDRFEAIIAPAVRISRLGKSVGAKFAQRYFSEVAPSIHFRATNLREHLLQEGLPADMAQSFDRSLIMGRFIDWNALCSMAPLRLVKNGETVAEWSPSDFSISADEALEMTSAYNTVKTGDLLIPGLSKPVDVTPGDRIELTLAEERLLLVAIK